MYLNVQFGGERQKVAPAPTPRQPSTKRPSIVQVTPEPPKVDPPKPVDPPMPPQPPVKVDIKRVLPPIEGVPAGYYVIIGVYASPRNAYNFRQQRAKRYEVGSFVNKQNGMTYVYLGKGAMPLEEAQNLMRKQMLNVDFIDGIWILEVKER